MNWEVLGPSAVVCAPVAAVAESSAVVPRGHRYTVSVISRAINLVLSANTTLRAAARSFVMHEQAACPFVLDPALVGVTPGLV